MRQQVLKMEASVRVLACSHHSLLRRSYPPRHHLRVPNPKLHCPASLSQNHPQTNEFAHIFSSSSSSLSSQKGTVPFSFHSSPLVPNGPVITAVLLGWLGSKEKHLRRYVELYTSRGVDCVTFVAGVGDVLSFDLGTRLEERILGLSNHLANWLQDGKQRLLMFHTFSNTGWLAYGAILDNFRGRDDLLGKIAGCVVDSGGDPNIDPKVWAAGFTAALLEKRSTLTSAPIQERVENLEASAPELTVKEKEPPLLETLLLSAFEKLFTYILNIPHINRRLAKVIRALNDQPPCPQLYLYSTADKVIPSKSVESFIDDQRRGGKKVWSHNFVSSPHVDHYRTFPDVYTSELETFLKECVRGRSREK